MKSRGKMMMASQTVMYLVFIIVSYLYLVQAESDMLDLVAEYQQYEHDTIIHESDDDDDEDSEVFVN